MSYLISVVNSFQASKLDAMIGLVILMAVALAVLIALLTAMLAWEMRHPPRHTAAYAIARGLATDPAEINLSFQPWTLDRSDGARLPVWEITIPQSKFGNPTPLTAIFIHGWGHSRIDSLARIKPLDELCSRIILYDLRGHGDSTGTATLGDADVADVIALIERLGTDPLILVGHSMGAVIAVRASLDLQRKRSSERIVGIVASGPYCEFHRSLIGRLRNVGLPARPITDCALLLQLALGVKPASLSEVDLQSLRTPLLVIHGSDDGVAPIEHGRRIAQAAPHATFIEVPDARHADVHVIDAARNEQAIREFIHRVASP